MHAIYHDKDSKTHWNDYLCKETVYKDIHIHVLIKTVEGQDVESIATAIDYNCNIEYAKRGKYAYNNMLSYLIHAERLSKHHAASDVLTIVGGDYQDIHRADKTNWQKGEFVKQKNKNTQANECPNRCLINQKEIMDNEASRAYIENMPETRMAYITNISVI